MSVSVCLFARMSRQPHVQTSPNFRRMFPFAVALTSYGSVAIRYVLPVCSRRQKTVENVEEEDVCASDTSSRFLALYKFVCMYMCHVSK